MNDFRLRISFFTSVDGVISVGSMGAHGNNGSGEAVVLGTGGSMINFGKLLHEVGVANTKNGIQLVNQRSYKGIMFDGKADSQGACNVGFTLNTTKVNGIVLYFDNLNNQHATKVEINGKTFSNNRYFLPIVTNNEKLLNIRITAWSEPYAMVKLTAIDIDYIGEFKKEYIKSIERNSSMLDNPTKVEYGISAQSGKVILQDRNSEILTLINNKTLKDGLDFELTLKGKTIGKYKSDNLQYSDSNKRATVDLIDDIVDLQQEIFQGIDFPTVPTEVVPLTALEVLTTFYPLQFAMNQVTKTHLASTIFAYPQMPQKDKYKALIDFTRATQCRVFKNEKGVLTIMKI